jgi:hypothetical protein
MSNKSEIEQGSNHQQQLFAEQQTSLMAFMSRRPATRVIPRLPLFQQQNHIATTTAMRTGEEEQKTKLLSILDSALAVVIDYDSDQTLVSPTKRRRRSEESRGGPQEEQQ